VCTFKEYSLNKANLVKASKSFAKSFVEDPLYIYLLEGVSEKEEFLTQFFYWYLNAEKNVCKLYSMDNSFDVLMLIYFPKEDIHKVRNFVFKGIFMIKSLKIIKYYNIFVYKKFLKIIMKMNSDWLLKLGHNNYIHLDLLSVNKKNRNKGFGDKCIEFLKQLGKDQICTLETQNIKNVKYYRKRGFCEIENISLKGTNINQYCMIYK